MMVSWLALQGALLLLAGSVAPATVAATDEPVVLIEVNGTPITSDHIDAMIMDSHRQMDMAHSGEELLVRLLDKAVNDELILQEAAAMGLHEETEVIEKAEEVATAIAVREFVRDRYEQPRAISDEEIEDFFSEMYHRIQLRRVSVRTREEADAVRASIVAGADMGAIAMDSSLDSKAHVGGLMNFIHWADLPVVFRDPSEELEVGELSEPFAVNDAWTIVRVEQRAAPDRSELPEYANFIRGVLLEEKKVARWKAFIDELRAQTPVTVDETILDGMRADAGVLLRGEFRLGTETPTVIIDDDHYVDEGALRESVSKVAMEMGDQDFESVLAKGIEVETERLLLRTHAERAGFFEHEKVVEAYDAKLEEVLINVYLNETVVSKIFFEREEFEAFYDDNKDRFRSSSEVKLSFFLLEDEETAEAAFERLEEGTDFDYLRREMGSGGHGDDTAKWAPLNMFAPELIDAVETMSIGETSPVLPFNSRWMIVRLDGRRDGDLLPIEEVDMQIRQVLFQEQFKKRLDEKLILLKERSEIVRHDDRIRQYFAAES